MGNLQVRKARGWGGGKAGIVLVIQALGPEFRSPAPMSMLGVVAHTWDNGWEGQDRGIPAACLPVQTDPMIYCRFTEGDCLTKRVKWRMIEDASDLDPSPHTCAHTHI